MGLVIDRQSSSQWLQWKDLAAVWTSLYIFYVSHFNRSWSLLVWKLHKLGLRGSVLDMTMWPRLGFQELMPACVYLCRWLLSVILTTWRSNLHTSNSFSSKQIISAIFLRNAVLTHKTNYLMASLPKTTEGIRQRHLFELHSSCIELIINGSMWNFLYYLHVLSHL